MTRTSDAREHLFRLYRSGTATDQELADAQHAYHAAATAEGVVAAADAIGPLTAEQLRTLAVLLAPQPPRSSPPPPKLRRRRRATGDQTVERPRLLDLD
jgi:hypothetical protein